MLKRNNLLLFIFCIFSSLISCNVSSFDYNESAQDIFDWLYKNYGNDENFDVISVSYVDDENSKYIFYTVCFEMDYNTLTDEGIIAAQETIIYCVLRSNSSISINFNLSDSGRYQAIYDEYLSVKQNDNAFFDTYFPHEIDDMLIEATNNN